jgi:hypothetical protein
MKRTDLTVGRWYWWMRNLLKLTDATSGAYVDLERRSGSATLDGYRAVDAEDLDAYQDRLLSSALEPGASGRADAIVLSRLDEVRRDNGLPPYLDRRFERALDLLGSADKRPAMKTELELVRDQLAAARDQLQAVTLDLEAERAESSRLRKLNAELSRKLSLASRELRAVSEDEVTP